MEDRLKRQQPHGGSPRVQRPTVANAFGDVPPKVPDKDNELPASPSRLEHKHSSSRPATARAGQQAVPGALPPTPVASEGDYRLCKLSHFSGFDDCCPGSERESCADFVPVPAQDGDGE
jgi:hypothetical protein